MPPHHGHRGDDQISIKLINIKYFIIETDKGFNIYEGKKKKIWTQTKCRHVYFGSGTAILSPRAQCTNAPWMQNIWIDALLFGSFLNVRAYFVLFCVIFGNSKCLFKQSKRINTKWMSEAKPACECVRLGEGGKKINGQNRIRKTKKKIDSSPIVHHFVYFVVAIFHSHTHTFIRYIFIATANRKIFMAHTVIILI